jgi:hypothetical protein
MPQQLVVSRNINFRALPTKVKSSIFLVCSIFLAVHCYRHPSYSIDLLSYIGNVVDMENTDPIAFAVFPSYEVWFYSLFFVSTGIAPICMARERTICGKTRTGEDAVPITTRTAAA